MPVPPSSSAFHIFRITKMRIFSVSPDQPDPGVDTDSACNFPDATANISIWSNVEAGLGITAGSLVTVRPLFRFFRGTGYDQQQSSRTADAWQLAGMNVNADRLPQDIQEVDRIWRVSTGAETGDGISGAVQASSQSRLCTHEDLDTRPDSFHGHKASFKSSNEA